MARVIIVGTSHISPQSISLVCKTIIKEKPECVALELCEQRYHFLITRSKKSVLRNGLLFYILHIIQQYLGKSTGIFPGAEMLSAIRLAKKVNAKIAFIDKNIIHIAEKINSIPVAEKIKLIGNVIFGLAEIKKLDLKKVPPKKIIKRSMAQLRKDFPILYSILIKERNKYMANWIKILARNYKKIVVVVGVGHTEGIKKLLEKKGEKDVKIQPAGN